MRHHITFTSALLCFAIINCETASVNLDEGCKFKNEKGECVTVIEKPKPDNKDIYCKDYYEISGKSNVPLVFKEGKHPALAMEFPHMVAIGHTSNQNVTKWSCGGILISKQHILTSGICLRNERHEAGFVRLGDLNIKSDAGPYRQDFTIQKIFIHPEYKVKSYYHDVGIAQLDRPVDINPFAVPACLNTKAEIPLNELYSASGWGIAKNGESSSPTLQKIVINIVENKECVDKLSKGISKTLLPNGIDDSLYICVGAPNTNTCRGDSGGPLQQINENGVSVVYGLIAFGPTGCERANLPEVHTRVSRYVDWIKSIIE